MIVKTTCLLILVCSLLSAAEERWVVSSSGQEVPFYSWQAEAVESATAILVLVPGYNGDGVGMLDVRWKSFAEKNRLVLLAPTFKAEGDENNRGKGYYYPEQGSGRVLEKGIAEAGKQYGVQTDKVLFFGFSAGAHVTHRFAIWKPEKVGGFVAYSAGWWSAPVGKIREVPALIMCGEDDPRYGPTFDFFKKGKELGCPWVWKSFAGVGHELTGPVREMAEVFLEDYAKRLAEGKRRVISER